MISAPSTASSANSRTSSPRAVIGAFTATATQAVRDDIVRQLRLDKPAVLVGSFDRPNLVYKAVPRSDGIGQVREILEKHKNESGIIYCIRRRDVDELCATLQSHGYSIAPYHAGMDDEARKINQDAFINEKVNTIIATVAFGMGIDKSNVRYVVHTAMPKSLEHYQQESGRAGRDGLEAECTLLYSAGDFHTWKSVMRDSEPEILKIAVEKLREMLNYCAAGICRHKALLRYFGQDLNKPSCMACDVCLGEMDSIDEPLITAQKILSCVVRVGQRFGGQHVAMVLTGSDDERITKHMHHELSTFGLLKDHPTGQIQNWIEQLAGQDCLIKTGEFNILQVTPKGWEVMRGKEVPRLFKPARKTGKTAKAAVQGWAGVDAGLFEELRKLRASIAEQKHVPAFVIFADTVLRDLARFRPSTPQAFSQIKGIGVNKTTQYSNVFVSAINKYCLERSLKTDVSGTIAEHIPPRPRRSKPNKLKSVAFKMFDHGRPVGLVADTIGRAHSTTADYLCEYIEERKLASPEPWVDSPTFAKIAHAAGQFGTERSKPIFDFLGETVTYDQIRISLTCLRSSIKNHKPEMEEGRAERETRSGRP
jgi:ATP-dependent DNA helicase RecQ